MDTAHAATASECAGLAASKGSNGNLREVDLNETPAMQNKRLRSRMETLMKTEKGTPDEQRIKRTRFMELKEDAQRASIKNMEHC
ncbi:hypothetical protein SADUNF_Sadunf15G0101000 [Salix dunnii]|uniref:NPR1/NIM1-like C-terminal domain-containing protein n=1 Tax=Salix dunnii TaxID=1413687 RepID=A0A835MSP3_9ROSI|nr:hypothetical protein SADUNF_Sadunf15G0101000 [Salix dunnii]